MSGERARLFVAADLPEAVRAELAAWAREVATHDQLRPLPADNLHVTLCFLGWREEQQVADLSRLVAGCARPARSLGLRSPVWLPSRRPRVLAFDLDDRAGELQRLQKGISDTLASAGAHRPELRPFRPHVTVARAGSGAKVADLGRGQVAPRRFEATALTLYRSHLGRAGARYETVLRIRL